MLRVTPKPTPPGVSEFNREMNRLAAEIGRFNLVPWTFDQVIKKAASRRKQKLIAARETLLNEPLSKADAKITMFVKADKCNNVRKSYLGGKPFKPRAIMFRGDRYVLCHSKYVKPIESVFSKIVGRCMYPIFAKSLNMQQRAQLLDKKMSRFSNPHIFKCDASAFDGSVRKVHLAGVSRLTQRVLGYHVEYDRLSSWRMTNKIRCMQSGARAVIKERRMSGDSDTSCGNCLIMASAIASTMRRMGIKQYELLNDGDDCLIITEQGVIDADAFNRYMAEIGFECDGEYAGSDIEDAEFCRSRPVYLDSGLTFVNKIDRKMSTLFSSHKHYNSEKQGSRTLLAVTECILAVTPDMPILAPLAERVNKVVRPRVRKDSKYMRTLANVIHENFYHDRLRLLRHVITQDKWRSVTPTIESRLSFERAFNISPQIQVVYEDFYRNLRPCDLDLKHFEQYVVPGISNQVHKMDDVHFNAPYWVM